MSTDSWDAARKSYLTSLRAKLRSAYKAQHATGLPPDRRWLNGFMAAGFHSGLVTLQELMLEGKQIFRKVYGRSMLEREERLLASRLERLCE